MTLGLDPGRTIRTGQSDPSDLRVLVLAPTANDGELSARFLRQAELDVAVCTDMTDLGLRVQEGCGAILLAEEVMTPSSMAALIRIFQTQPSWSDIPITLVSSKGLDRPASAGHIKALSASATITIIERPFRPDTLVSMLTTALRSRSRQYQMRDLVGSLRASEARVRRIFDQTVVGIAEMDFNGRFTMANDRYCAIAGRERPALLALKLVDIVHAQDAAETRARIAALAAGTSTHFIVEKRIVRPDGALAWVHDHLSVVRDAEGRLCGLTVASADITSLKANQQQLTQARDEALAASRAKDDFLASLSHELRTPLNPVLLLSSEGAKDATLAPEIRSHFEVISRSVALEARLIDDLLDLTRISRGKLLLQRTPQSIPALLNEAITMVRADFNDKNIRLERHFTETPLPIVGDAVRLQQVFWNVLKNAVKFTPRGGLITVETSTTGAGQRALIKITDTGIGLSPAEIKRIFDAFIQGDDVAKMPHRFGGLGLGLAISKQLVGLHEGTITASSAGPGQGSTFTIELPLSLQTTKAEKATAPSPATSATPAEPRHILLVDDHEPSRAALGNLLQRRRFRVSTAADVSEALAIAQQGGIDLVVSDIGLPDGNGYDLMKKLSTDLGLRGIAISGYGMEKDVAQSEQAGFVAHLTKPVRIEALDAALRTVLA